MEATRVSISWRMNKVTEKHILHQVLFNPEKGGMLSLETVMVNSDGGYGKPQKIKAARETQPTYCHLKLSQTSRE